MPDYTFIDLSPANDNKHKYIAEYKNKYTGKLKSIKFGANGYKDYIQYYKEEGKMIADEKNNIPRIFK